MAERSIQMCHEGFQMTGRRWVLLALLAAGGCGGSAIDTDATLVEGRGIEPHLILGTTTLTQAKSVIGETTSQPSTSGQATEWDIGAYRLHFFSPNGGTEPVLHAITGMRRNNPQMPNFSGETGRGIGFLDSDEEMRAAYGPPAAEWIQTGGRVFYYPDGAVFYAEHPSSITGYDGPPPTPTGLNITRITVTVPFQILEAPEAARSGQLNVTSPPKTSLPVSVD